MYFLLRTLLLGVAGQARIEHDEAPGWLGWMQLQRVLQVRRRLQLQRHARKQRMLLWRIAVRRDDELVTAGRLEAEHRSLVVILHEGTYFQKAIDNLHTLVHCDFM